MIACKLCLLFVKLIFMLTLSSGHCFDFRIKEMNTEDELSPLQPRLINARDYNIINFEAEQVLFVVISTSGDGL